jgi:predicted glycosyltransferase
MATAAGVLCGAGFETPAEALFMQKKLMVIPMKGQYEQQCNAAALKDIGVPVIKSLKIKHADKIRTWLQSDKRIEVNYPDITANIINTIFSSASKNIKPLQTEIKTDSPKRLRNYILKKIFAQLT